MKQEQQKEGEKNQSERGQKIKLKTENVEWKRC